MEAGYRFSSSMAHPRVRAIESLPPCWHQPTRRKRPPVPHPTAPAPIALARFWRRRPIFTISWEMTRSQTVYGKDWWSDFNGYVSATPGEAESFLTFGLAPPLTTRRVFRLSLRPDRCETDSIRSSIASLMADTWRITER